MISCDGRLQLGFDADWDLVPDLHDLVLDVERAFAELRQAAAVTPGAEPGSPEPAASAASAERRPPPSPSLRSHLVVILGACQWTGPCRSG